MTLHLVVPPTGLEWSVDRRGQSGARYRLRFHGQALHWIARMEDGKSGPFTYRYWRRWWYRKGRDARKRFGPKLTAIFADLGIDDPAAYVAGQHVRFKRVE